MNFVTKEPINKGWSSDKKYCVTDENGTRYLLRVSDIAQHDTKQSEFNMMKQVASFGVPMCQPIEFGTCEDGVYSIQSWIDGEDAEQVMSGYSDTEQYVYGLEAGRILRKIHSIPAPATQEDWEIRFNRKMDYKIKKYVECPIKYENGQAFIDYINENRHLLKNRPQVYQHGDYHIGNSYASGYHTDAEQIQNNIDRCGAPLAYPFGLSRYTHFVTDQKQLFSNTPSYRLEVE